MSDERPPADVMPAELFFDKKCGKSSEEHDYFFKWCSNPTDSRISVNCTGVGGIKGDCRFGLKFGFELTKNMLVELQYLNPSSAVFSNTTESSLTTVITTTESAPKIPNELVWNYDCHYAGKKSGLGGRSILTTEVAEKIVKTCHQELYGYTKPWPLWLILLVILIILSTLSFAGFLFWKYWLRPKLYGRQAGGVSTLGSQWTSVPLSNSSAISKSSSMSRRRRSSAPSNQSIVASRAKLESSPASGLPSMSRLPSLRSSRTEGIAPASRSTSLNPSGAGPNRSMPYR